MIKIIVAVGNYIPEKGFPIGKNGGLAWNFPEDLKWFRKTTEHNIVVMGRNTYKSFGGKPLQNRDNYIVSNSMTEIPEGFCGILHSIDEIVDLSKNQIGDVYIIGGAELYRSVLDADIVDEVLNDFIDVEVPDADTFFQPLDLNKWKIDEEGIRLSDKCTVNTFKHAKFFNDVDEQYLNLVQDVIVNGELKETRAGMTRSVFGKQLRFNLKNGLPLLTTKKVYTNGIIHELIWFLKGDTNIKYLVDNNVHIWDDDAYRYYLELVEKNNEVFKCDDTPLLNAHYFEPITKEEFLKAVIEEKDCWLYLDRLAGFMSYYPNNYYIHYKFGDLGPVYGEQWRNWYGVDQIKTVIETLRTNPDDRRMIVSAWNVKELDKMALPPCHYSFQFYTKKMDIVERMNWALEHNLNCWDEKSLDDNNVPSRKLSCLWNQRSVDSICGLPFNIASYAILTYMIAQCCNMKPDELIFNGGDVHVYENHIEAFTEQLYRNPHKYALPQLELNPNVKEIDDFRAYDIKIVGYQSYPAIKYQLNVGLNNNNGEAK
jgi:thymidylate synthase